MHQEESFATGIAYMLLSATAMAVVGFFGKLGSEGLPLTSLIFWRFLIAFVFAFLFLWMFGYFRHGIQLRNIKLNFYRSFFTLTSQLSFYYYIQHNSLLNGVVLLNMGPLFIPLIEKFFLNRPMGKSTWVGLIVAFIGLLCVLQPDSGIFSGLSFIGVLAGLCQGISQVLFGSNAKKENGEMGVLFLFGILTLMSAILYFAVDRFSLTHENSTAWIVGLLLCLGAASVGNQLSRVVAYRHGTPSRLAPFFYISVIVAGFLEWIFLGEIPNALSGIGASLVILGGILKIYLRYHILKNKK